MVLILGQNSFVSKRFQKFFDYKKIEYRAISLRKTSNFKDLSHLHYGGNRYSMSEYEVLKTYIELLKPHLIINCIGYTGVPNVDACEDNKEECFSLNVSFVEMISSICKQYGITLGHVSSGCIYESDYNHTIDLGFFGRSEPGIMQYYEDAVPNFCFGTGKPCSFYSGTKKLAEDIVNKICNKKYIWRLRMPFNHIDSPKNYISKILKYPKVWSIDNSITNVDEFVQACYLTWSNKNDYGTYNIVNPDALSAKDIIEHAKEIGFVKDKEYEYFSSLEEFNKVIKAPRSNCVLRPDKLINSGIPMLNALDSITKCFQSWNQEEKPIFW